MKRVVVIGQRALASADFLLGDFAGTSGRLDVLMRALRAALLVSHGVRRDTDVYLVLLGGPLAPRSIRVDGGMVRFLRPDDHSLGVLAKKILAAPVGEKTFTEVRPAIALAEAGIEVVIDDCASATPYVLEEGAPDVRTIQFAPDAVFFVGDNLGFDPATRARIAEIGALPVSVGPVSVHAEDAVAILMNELDRREMAAQTAASR